MNGSEDGEEAAVILLDDSVLRLPLVALPLPTWLEVPNAFPIAKLCATRRIGRYTECSILLSHSLVTMETN